MIVFSLSKKGDISYVSHIDYMRILQRALGRAGLAAELSGGFNRHPVTYCSHPLPVGVQSEAEYFTIKPRGEYTMQEISKFQLALPKGICVNAIYRMNSNPNIAGKVIDCDYRVIYSGSDEQYEHLSNALSGESVMMTFDSKGDSKCIDIAPLLRDIRREGNYIVMRLATGNPTLRPDRLIEFFNGILGEQIINICDTIRVSHIMTHGESMITASELLENNYIEKYTY